MIEICGPILSTILCIFFAAAIFLTDSIHLLFPVVESLRFHTSMVVKLYGPLIGIRNMDKFHGCFTTMLTLPIIAGIWHQHPAWALITITILATLQPYFILIAYYMKSCNVRNPILPVIYSAVFGIPGLLWREIDHESSFLSKYDIPMVTLWHTFVSIIILVFVNRIKSNLPKLDASIQLEKIKADSIQKGDCSWPNAKEMPFFNEGLEPYPILVESANLEQEQIIYSQSKTIISLFFLILAGFIFGTSVSTTHRELIDDKIIMISLFCVTLPLVLLQLILITLYIKLSSPREEKELFDNIEGARSFD